MTEPAGSGPDRPWADGSLVFLGFGDTGRVGFVDAGRAAAPVAARGQFRFGAGPHARVLPSFGFSGAGCACIECPQAGQEGLIHITPEPGMPPVGDGAVLEFVFRPVIERPVDLEGFPLVRVLGSDGAGEAGWPVMVELRARGKATTGVYDIEVTSGKAITGSGGASLPQAEWVRYVLHRRDGQVALYVGLPGAERAIAAYPDFDPDAGLSEILLGNAGNPWARGTGHWDDLRLGPDGRSNS